MNTNKTINQTASKTTKAGMFVTEDGQNVLFTFLPLILLLALWGFCKGMIDVMDKHFQKVLHLSLSQSAWVQFAHYLGYFLMALPAGWLAAKLGYKGGIMGGAILPKVMGAIADMFDLSRGFIVPMVCFAFIAGYALCGRDSAVPTACTGSRPQEGIEHSN